jgi:hypothetical protein
MQVCTECLLPEGHHPHCPNADSGRSRHLFLLAGRHAKSPLDLASLSDYPLDECVDWWRRNRIKPMDLLEVTENNVTFKPIKEYSAQDSLWNEKHAGKEAGWINSRGQIVVKLFGRQYALANWLRKYGHEQEASWIEKREHDSAGDTASLSAGVAQSPDS